MAGTKEIKRRIKSIKNTKKITKAMELVAASKMKKAVSSALASRLYAEYSWEILSSVAQNMENTVHPYFEARDINNVLLVLISSNRGLCGAYNAQIIKKAFSFLKKENENINIDIVTIGKKGDIAMRRLNKKIIATFSEIDDEVNLFEIIPIAKMLSEEYTSARYDRVLVAYTDFISPLVQRANLKQLLPVLKSDLKDLLNSLETDENKFTNKEKGKINYLFEGDFNTLISSLAEKITQMQIYQMILESNASEQSARMIAMKNASEASGEMIDDLTLMFNKARQANITREISEISAGMASVN